MKKMVFALMLGLFVVGCQPKTETVVVRGEKGDQGEMGPRGETGATGMSAYELAVKNGFVGTEIEWLQSLIGATGAAGKDGVDGSDGNNGKSAYELWLELPGNANKTLTQFIESLKGVPGVQGPQGVAGLNGVDGTPGQSCSVSKSGSVATIACGVGNSVTISDGTNGVNPVISVTSAVDCTYGGVIINGITSCFGGTAISSGLTKVVKLCKDLTKNSQEYGLVINGELYAVFHSERCNSGNGVPGTQDVNGLYTCKLNAEQNSKMSNTYLAKLTLGSTYVTTDGTECNFTASLN